MEAAIPRRWRCWRISSVATCCASNGLVVGGGGTGVGGIGFGIAAAISAAVETLGISNFGIGGGGGITIGCGFGIFCGFGAFGAPPPKKFTGISSFARGSTRRMAGEREFPAPDHTSLTSYFASRIV
jgi:hypothetical protein